MEPREPSKQASLGSEAAAEPQVMTSVPRSAPLDPGRWQAPTAATVATTSRTRPGCRLAREKEDVHKKKRVSSVEKEGGGVGI